jgi:hypothetical protein
VKGINVPLGEITLEVVKFAPGNVAFDVFVGIPVKPIGIPN